MNQNIYQVRTIYNKTKKDSAIVTVPGSKSITNRALLLATLADGESLLKGALFSDDSRYFLKCIQELGYEAEADEEQKTVRVRPRSMWEAPGRRQDSLRHSLVCRREIIIWILRSR